MHPSSFYIGNNLENVGILVSTMLYLQLYKCCLRFTWMFVFDIPGYPGMLARPLFLTFVRNPVFDLRFFSFWKFH